MRVVVAILFICFVDHFHITRNFAFDTCVGSILHPALMFEIHCTLLYIVDGASDDLSLLVLIDSLVDIGILFT